MSKNDMDLMPLYAEGSRYGTHRKKPKGKEMNSFELSDAVGKWKKKHRKKGVSMKRYKRIAGRWV